MAKEGIIQNLENAINLEEQAQGACEELMSFFADKQTIDTIRYVRDDETKHIGLVRELIRIIKKY
ncbi:hypothetical protein KKA15_03780 [Patescibacteria group bacterium]|nr:hypothetical protein [Patescibacteria group bacterium]